MANETVPGQCWGKMKCPHTDRSKHVVGSVVLSVTALQALGLGSRFPLYKQLCSPAPDVSLL